MSGEYTPRHAATGISTQRAHPWRATLRTAAWYVIGALLALSVAIPVATDTLGDYMGARVTRWLLWFAGLCGAIVLTVQRIVLLAPVAALLQRIGLGTGADGAPEGD